MRHTELPEEVSRFYTNESTREKLDAFWELIENHYEDEWRVEISGIVSLVVDDAMLERILHDNVAVAWYKFGSNLGGWDENDHRYFTSRPEYLKGLWSIEGVYNHKMAYVGGPRTYAFEPEG
jgi:hypothetical protein